MAAVAGIDHGAIDFLREQFNGAGVAMPHDNQVRVHGIERDGGVDQGLAFLDGGGTDRHVHDIGAKALARQLERALGAG